MPRLRPAPLLLALAACGPARFDTPFDAGQEVHFIVSVESRPHAPVEVQPVCTVGSFEARSRPWTFAPAGARSLEVATLEVPAGHYRVSIWDPRTRAQGRADAQVDRELWVVLRIRPDGNRSRLDVFSDDPFEDIGPWRPLTPIPD
ncbi:MAG: hypothetical protein ACE5JG_06520 [Planctomycetota bacterium]